MGIPCISGGITLDTDTDKFRSGKVLSVWPTFEMGPSIVRKPSVLTDGLNDWESHYAARHVFFQSMYSSEFMWDGIRHEVVNNFRCMS